MATAARKGSEMFRIVGLGDKWYGKEMESLDEEQEDILDFVEQGTPVIITDMLESLKAIGLESSDIILAKDIDAAAAPRKGIR